MNEGASSTGPRLHQVRFAERHLPTLYYRNPEGMFRLLDRDPDRTMTALWHDAGRRIAPNQRLPPPPRWDVRFKERDGRRIAMAHLWRPQAAPEAGFVAVVLGEPGIGGQRHAAYWISGLHAEDGELFAVVRGVTQDRRVHVRGPQTDGEEGFMERVLPLELPPANRAWVDLFDLMPTLGLPVACTDCRAFWNEQDYGLGRRDHVLDLTCDNGHDHRFHLNEEQFAKLELEIASWLAGKPVVLVGGPSDGLQVDLPGGAPGSTILHHDEVYVFARQLDHAYEYRHQRSDDQAP